nr:arabinogalactan protein 1-like [Aegilops tauschii subsp. strangulata]
MSSPSKSGSKTLEIALRRHRTRPPPSDEFAAAPQPLASCHVSTAPSPPPWPTGPDSGPRGPSAARTPPRTLAPPAGEPCCPARVPATVRLFAASRRRRLALPPPVVARPRLASPLAVAAPLARSGRGRAGSGEYALRRPPRSPSPATAASTPASSPVILEERANPRSSLREVDFV